MNTPIKRSRAATAKPGGRTIWMFPRNKRKLKPLEMVLQLRAYISSGGKSGLLKKQKRQDSFSKALNAHGLKKGGVLEDRRSGGARTYEAQFKALGLIYFRNGRLELTQEGQALADGTGSPAEIVQRRVVFFQYPSPYSLGSGVNMDKSVRIRPFAFLLELAADEDVDGLSVEEMIVPILYARSDRDFSDCKQSVLTARALGLRAVVKDDSRIRTKKTAGRTYEQRLSDLKDIANTFKNAMESVGLVSPSATLGTARFLPTPRALELVGQAKNLALLDFTKPDDTQNMRRYGKRPDSLKDTRKICAPSGCPKPACPEETVQELFLQRISATATEQQVSEFIEEMGEKFAVSALQVRHYLGDLLQKPERYAWSRLVGLAKGGLSTAGEFEKQVGTIFREDAGFVVAFTGQRKPKVERAGGFSDLYVATPDGLSCGLVDAKSTEIYGLPHQDIAKMTQTYIPSVDELSGEGPTRPELAFVAYVSHTISKGAEKRAKHLHAVGGVPVVLCSVYGLNRLREDARYRHNPDAIVRLFTESSVLVLD